MKFPRLTTRNLMFITAVFAVGLFVAQETWEGMPPRSVVQGIPARIAQLEPGMSYLEVHEILGLAKSWSGGGTDAKHFVGEDYGSFDHTIYTVGPVYLVPGKPNLKGFATSRGVSRSHAMIELWFDLVPSPKLDGGRKLRASRLTRASFSIDDVTIAEMPAGR
jgi:hypothetical protein